MISAKDARLVSAGQFERIKQLADDVFKQCITLAEERITKAASNGEFNAIIDTSPIVKLNDISNEASKRAMHLLAGTLRQAGYSFDEFNNHTQFVEIYWIS